ncbi:hypothetical protein [Sphingomonas panacisoli]|uniref:hypothetical protein n=1 Tax=Sphingomonas panacisoli TaxID=1813879 RepID=UPI001646A27C|nr:hypothetical protein [Sphingomonas panacisoli]
MLLTEIAAIDQKLLVAANALGLTPEEIEAPAPAPRLEKRVDARSAGTMSGWVRDFFKTADRGYTRTELREVIANHDPAFADALRKNMNGFYNLVGRAIGREEIKDVRGVLYPFDRAPIDDDEQEEDQSPSLPLADNVTPIIPAERAR